MGLRAGLDRCGKSCPPPGFDLWTVQPIGSRYTNYATQPTTTRFNIQQFYTVLTFHLCVVYGSQSEQRHYVLTTLTDWFCVTGVESV